MLPNPCTLTHFIQKGDKWSKLGPPVDIVQFVAQEKALVWQFSTWWTYCKAVLGQHWFFCSVQQWGSVRWCHIALPSCFLLPLVYIWLFHSWNENITRETDCRFSRWKIAFCSTNMFISKLMLGVSKAILTQNGSWCMYKLDVDGNTWQDLSGNLCCGTVCIRSLWALMVRCESLQLSGRVSRLSARYLRGLVPVFQLCAFIILHLNSRNKKTW